MTNGIRRAAAPAAAIAIAIALAGCTSGGSTLSDGYQKTAGKGYTSADGSITTIDPSARKAGPTWTAEDYDGTAVSTASLAGKVVVLNFWYAGCPPCRLEAPELSKLHSAFADKGVVFVGVNTRDGATVARDFTTTRKLGYTSVLDQAENTLQLAYTGFVSANVVPTTLVLDTKGRVAARFSGVIDSPSVVTSVLDDTLAESK